MRTTLRWVVFAILSLPVVGLSIFAWSRPDQFSRMFLRTGGRIVKEMADRPARVAAFLAVCVVILWIIIGARCVWESWREHRESPEDVSQSVAKG